MYTLIILAAIILLPIAPAYLLFKALPSNAMVSGPLQGFTVNLGGAFAGYFAVLIVALAAYPGLSAPPAYQVWEVSGMVTDDSGNPIQTFDPTDIAISPPPNRLDVGSFEQNISTWPGQGGAIDFPALTISHKNYLPVTIDLDPSGKSLGTRGLVTWDKTHHRITISPVALKKLPVYGQSGTTVAAAPAPSLGADEAGTGLAGATTPGAIQ